MTACQYSFLGIIIDLNKRNLKMNIQHNK